MSTSVTLAPRSARIERSTLETRIVVDLDLGGGRVTADTGVPFLDHMLSALGKHGRIGLVVACDGDAEIDPHHTVEDVGIVIGQALKQALGDRRGIQRYGHAYAPLDEALARVVVDCSGRPFLHYEVQMPEAEAACRIATKLYQGIRREHDWGSRFEPEPRQDVLDRLSTLAPREMRRAWMTGFGNAKLAGRNQVEVADLPDLGGKKVPIGFVH